MGQCKSGYTKTCAYVCTNYSQSDMPRGRGVARQNPACVAHGVMMCACQVLDSRSISFHFAAGSERFINGATSTS